MRQAFREIRVLLPVAAFGFAAIWVAFAQEPAAQKAASIDDTALANAGKTGSNWISYNVNWSEQRYSPLTQIDDSNVSRLGLAWSADIPAAPGRPQNHQEGTPLVYNGVLYSITPWSVVYAVDAHTGKELWRSDPEVNQQVWQSRICCGVVNRGIALYEDKVIAPVVDGRLRALDMKTGRIAWETRVSPANMPYTITMAPRIIKGGRVIIGVSGGEYGIRGFFDAYNVNTGKREWRFYTVPGDPSKPFEQPELAAAAKTWSGDWWKLGGGAPVWNGMAYDPESDTLYVGTGQPGPWTDVYRGPGDNLFTDCILAVRGATGKLVWYYQEVPGDNWDFDSIADLMLADLTINGRKRQVIMQAPKDGFFYVLDRHTGELLSADPWVTVTWASGVNLKTGRPIVNPEARYTTSNVNVMPGPGGGHVWPPWSFNPSTGLVYIPSTIGTGYGYSADPNFVPASTDVGPTGRGVFNMGTGFGRGGRGRGGRGAAANGRGNAAAPPPGVDPAAVAAGRGRGAGQAAAAGRAGAAGGGRGPSGPAIPSIGPSGRGNILVAWDPVAAKERWRGLSAGFNMGGTLSTAGNLVFSSVNNRLLAYRADNGDQLLDLDTHLSQMGPPMTFMLDGKQYIAVAGGPPAAGGRGGAGRGRGAAAGAAPASPGPPSHLLVFALDGHAPLPSAPAK
ncbi:MAG TPA: PQQ-binding-like beta-propeller repeat protein [Bryobacteraceae bacterium]|nr:PQQ-binding-like beta-propeller repeat protein [Bryobacteraceae bacterium]